MAVEINDDDLSLEQNIAAAHLIGKVAAEYNKPLTVDLQDGYGTELEEAVRRVIEARAVGINLEDYDKVYRTLYSPDEAASRVGRALSVAGKAGVPDFVVNARCDALVMGGKLEQAIESGKKYLEAGTTTVFI